MIEADKISDLADLSEAAYVNFGSIPADGISGDALKEFLSEGGASWEESRRDEFALHWRVVAHQPNTDTGFSATLFERLDPAPDESRYVVAMRGTEGGVATQIYSDLSSADIGDLVANGLAWKQIIDMYNWWQKVAAPKFTSYDQVHTVEISTELALIHLAQGRTDVIVEAGAAWQIVHSRSNDLGLGIIAPGEQVDVTGHSLGGHLATAFSRLFGQYTANVVSINGAGYSIVGEGTGNTNRLFSELGGAADFDAMRIVNLYGDRGVNLVTQDFGLRQPGTHLPVFIESLMPGQTFGHGAVQMAQSLSLYEMLRRLEGENAPTAPDEMLARYYTLLDAAGREQVAELGSSLAYEHTLDAVRGLLMPAESPTRSSDDSAFYGRLIELEKSDAFAVLMGGVRIELSGFDLDERARTDFSSLASLITLSPIVLSVTIPENKNLLNNVLATNFESAFVDWQMDKNLDGDDLDKGIGNYTDQWIMDRSNLLGSIITQYTQEGDSLARSNALPTDRAYEFRWADAQGTEQILIAENTARARGVLAPVPSQLIAFGTDVGDTMAGTGNALGDHLYGGAGADTLNGFGSDDYLEGNAGDDSLAGGDGRDELLGGAGEDTLDGCAGADRLVGGLANDTYRFSGNWGADTVVDGDGLGRLFVEGIGFLTGSDAEQITDGLWQTADRRVSYTLVQVDDGHSDLIITFSGRPDVITVRDWSADKSLGLTLAAGGASPTPSSGTFVGDFVKALMEGTQTYARADGQYVGAGEAESGAADLYTGRDSNEFIFGLDGNDALLGRSGADWVDGGAGNDVVMGGMGADTLFGGDGIDFIYGSSNGSLLYPDATTDEVPRSSEPGGWNGLSWYAEPTGDQLERYQLSLNVERDTQTDDAGNVINGGAGNDLILAGTGGDSVNAGADDDVVWGMAGDDTLLGGTGGDHIEGDGADADPTGVNLTHTAAQLHGGDLIDGGQGDDTLIGQGGDDWVFGGSGKDVLNGDGRSADDTPLTVHGDDHLDGGEGDDQIGGGGRADTLFGGSGNDTLMGDDGDLALADVHGDDYLDGEDGDDILAGDGGADTLFGGSGNDQLLGDNDTAAVPLPLNGADYADGQDGQDTLIGGGGNDTLRGGSDNDILIGDGTDNAPVTIEFQGADDLDGGAGNDTVTGGGGNDFLSGGSGDDVVFGSDGDDRLDGGSGKDVLIGGLGNDTLVSDGFDYLDGGDGIDVYDVASLQMQTLASGQSITFVPVVSDTAGVNRLQVNGEEVVAADVFVQNGRYYVNASGAGGQALVALGAQMAFTGLEIALPEGGSQSLQEVVETTSPTGLVRSAVWSMAAMPIYTSEMDTDQSVIGGARAEWLQGGAGDDFADGGAGADRLSGGAGADNLVGGDGADTLEGGTGNDQLTGDQGTSEAQRDVFLFARADGVDAITLDQHAVKAADRDVLRFDEGVSAADIEAYNMLAGTQDRFRLVIAYGEGDEIVLDEGGEGEIQELQFADGSVLSMAEVVAMARHLQDGDAPAPVGGESGGLKLTGTAADDLLAGGSQEDVLRGMDGNDSLLGGAGFDLLVGGADSNTYLFGPADGADQIEATPGEMGLLRFEQATLADVSAWVDGHDLVLSSGTGQTVRLLDQADVKGQGLYQGWVVEAGNGGSTSLAALVAGASGGAAMGADQRKSAFVDLALGQLRSRSQAEVFDAQYALMPVVPSSVTVKSMSGATLTLPGYFTSETQTSSETISGRYPIYKTRTTTVQSTVGDGHWLSLEHEYPHGGVQSGDSGSIWVMTNSHIETSSVTETIVIGWQNYSRTVHTSSIKGFATLTQVTGSETADLVQSAGLGTPAPALFRGTIDTGNGNDTVQLASGNLGNAEALSRTEDWAAFSEVDATSTAPVSWPYNDERVLMLRDHGLGAWIDAGAGDDTVQGTDAHDVIVGGTGSDWMDGQAGADVYLVGAQVDAVDHIADIATLSPTALAELAAWNQAYHADLLLDYDEYGVPVYGPRFLQPLHNQDVVEFDSSIELGALSYRWTESSEGEAYRTLELLNGGAVFLQIDYAIGGGDAGIETFTFSDGTSFGLAELLNAVRMWEGKNLSGGAGSDTLVGSDAADTLAGGLGNDVLNGGDGNDLYVYSSDDDQDRIRDSAGIDTLRFKDVAGIDAVAARHANGPDGAAIFVSMLDATGGESTSGVWVPVDGTGRSLIENVQFFDGSSVAFDALLIEERVLWGTSAAETIHGDRRDDRIAVGYGADTVFGGTGNDVIHGDDGNDLIHGDGGDDQLFGDAGADMLYGDAGNDVLDGGAGADTMSGGWGDDRYLIGSKQDAVIENADQGMDCVESSVAWVLGDAFENLTLTGQGAIDGDGNAANNVLRGNGEANKLKGYAGDDDFDGGAGADHLVGAAGADTYRFGIGSGNDTVLDQDATAGVRDRIQFGAGIAAADVVSSRQGSDLLLRLTSSSTDSLVIKNWFTGTKYRVEDLVFADGSSVALGGNGVSPMRSNTNTFLQAQSLAHAMAQFDAGDAMETESGPWSQGNSLHGRWGMLTVPVASY